MIKNNIKKRKVNITSLKMIIMLSVLIIFNFTIILTSAHVNIVKNVFDKTLQTIAVRSASWQKDFAQKQILDSIDKLAWPIDTEESKWEYGTGDFKYKDSREIYKELGYESTEADSDYTSCSRFVDVVIYDALGVKIHIMPDDANNDWEELPKMFEIVHEGDLKGFELQPADIVRYKKNKAGGYRSQHSFIYYSNDTLAEAGIKIRYPLIRSVWIKPGVLKWENEEVDTSTIQVIRIRD